MVSIRLSCIIRLYLYSGAAAPRDSAQAGERRAAGERWGSQSEARVDKKQTRHAATDSMCRGENRA